MRRTATKRGPKPQTPGFTHRALIGSGEPEKGKLRYTCKSAARSLTHVVEVDLATLAVHCTCEHFKYRVKSATVVEAADRLCKHVRSFQRSILQDVARAKGIAA